MLKLRVIPVLLYKYGQLVKSVRFENWRNLGNPIQAIKVFNARNVDELIFLDITKTLDEQGPDYSLVAGVAKECFMPLAVGGGVRKLSQAAKLLENGADKVVINTGAWRNPKLIGEITKKFGRQCVVAAIDVRKGGDNKEKVVIGCGRQEIDIDPIRWAKRVEELGAGEIMLTSIDHEGMMEGFNTDLINRMCKAVSVPVIAHGGAGKLEDFAAAAATGAAGIAAASIFRYTEVTPADVRKYLGSLGYPVRKE